MKLSPRPPSRLLLLAFLILAGCTAQAQENPPTADEAALDAVYARFSEAYEKLDPQIVANLYTEDARYLSGGDGDMLRGRPAILDNFASFFTRSKENGVALRIEFRIVDRALSDDLAYDVGYYRLVSKKSDGEERTSVGKFVTVAKRQADGAWQFHVDSYSGAPVEAFDRPDAE